MIRIAIGGDFCPIVGVEGSIRHGVLSGAPLFEGFKNLTKDCDLVVLNLECPLTESENAIEKLGWNLKAHPESIELLNGLGVNLVTLANNHVLDFGQAGLVDTISVCSKHGIDTVGAGPTIDVAKKVHYRTIKGRDLAVINAGESEFASATNGRGGANQLDLIALLEDIGEARKVASHVVLILHGGLESSHYPSPQSIRLLRFLAEQGVTAIVRHHPHRVQGFEVWKSVPIFYSLGNFFFDWYTKVPANGWYEGILIILNICEDGGCTFEAHPFEQCQAGPSVRMLKAEEKTAFLTRLNDYSVVLHDEDLLQSEWDQTLEAREQEYFGPLTIGTDAVLRTVRRLGILRFFMPSRKRRLLLENFLRCDAHREVVLDILERLRTGRRRVVRTHVDAGKEQ